MAVVFFEHGLAFRFRFGLIILKFPSFEEGHFGLSWSDRFFSGVINHIEKLARSGKTIVMFEHRQEFLEDVDGVRFLNINRQHQINE